VAVIKSLIVGVVLLVALLAFIPAFGDALVTIATGLDGAGESVREFFTGFSADVNTN
jgi:hypothetical protein